MTTKRVQVSDLGEPTELPLLPDHVSRLADEWGSSGYWLQAWEDIDSLAQDFLATNSQDRRGTTWAWHHLLMAVGNFKRSAGLIVPTSLRCGQHLARRPTEFTIPDGASPLGASVARDEAGTWRNLTEIRGLGVPTATTLLAALWPDHHVIIDIRDKRAALGLRASRLSEMDLDDAGLPPESDSEYWRLYEEWFRGTVAATAERAGTSLLRVERALFILDERTKETVKGNWTWSTYRAEAERQLGQLRSAN